MNTPDQLAASALMQQYGWDERTAASVLLTITAVVTLTQKVVATPEKLATAMDDIRIRHNGHHDGPTNAFGSTWVFPTLWYVVDESQADWDCNYPGDLISEHATQEEARIGHAVAILERLAKP